MPGLGQGTDPDEGLVDLLIPRFPTRLGRLLLGRLRPEPMRFHLDALGSFVWRRMDGRSDLGRIAQDLAKRFPEAQDAPYERVASFALLLRRNGFLRLDPPDSTSNEDAPPPSAAPN